MIIVAQVISCGNRNCNPVTEGVITGFRIFNMGLSLAEVEDELMQSGWEVVRGQSVSPTRHFCPKCKGINHEPPKPINRPR